MVCRSWRLPLNDFSPVRRDEHQQTEIQAELDSQAHKFGDRGWGLNDTAQTGHCSDEGCRNYFSSSSVNFCPTCQNNPKAECYSHRERCVTCLSKFVELPGAECNDCAANEADGRYKQLWACKNCGEKHEGVDSKGFCEACAIEYNSREFCDFCGQFKYISDETYRCFDCENQKW